MRNSSNTAGAKSQEQKFREWDEAGSDHFEPMEPEDPNAPPGKSLEQLAEENPDLAGYRQALSGIIAQSLD